MAVVEACILYKIMHERNAMSLKDFRRAMSTVDLKITKSAGGPRYPGYQQELTGETRRQGTRGYRETKSGTVSMKDAKAKPQHIMRSVTQPSVARPLSNIIKYSHIIWNMNPLRLGPLEGYN